MLRPTDAAFHNDGAIFPFQGTLGDDSHTRTRLLAVDPNVAETLAVITLLAVQHWATPEQIVVAMYHQNLIRTH
jgi:hypothetical protein